MGQVAGHQVESGPHISPYNDDTGTRPEQGGISVTPRGSGGGWKLRSEDWMDTNGYALPADCFWNIIEEINFAPVN